MNPEMICQGCMKGPLELDSYKWAMMEEGDPEPTPEQVLEYVWEEEGTMNHSNGHFLCDQCYINAGMPTAPGGWTCP